MSPCRAWAMWRLAASRAAPSTRAASAASAAADIPLVLREVSMMRAKIFGFVALLPIVVACSSGSAVAATRNYGLTSFDRIQVTGPFDVHVHVGGSPSARATGPQEAIDRLSVEQHGNQLVIKPL